MPAKARQRKKEDSSNKFEDAPSTKPLKKSKNGPATKRNDDDDDDVKFQGLKIDFKRIIVRCLVIIGIISIVSLSQGNTVETFASQKDELIKKEVVIKCSEDYAQELPMFPNCVPKKCGRFISDNVVSLEEVQALLMIALKGFAMGGSGGGASILDLHSGALSQGENFINVYSISKAKKVITSEDLKLYRHVKDKIKAAIVSHFGLNPNKLYLTHPTFFSQITAQPPKTIHDEYWHPHVDKQTYESFHYTSLLYLTDYNYHFKGGRFIFIDKNVNRTVEPRVGRLSAFTSGSENLHFVEKVTSGTRFAITVSFTCDPDKGIKDPVIPTS